MDLRDRVYIRTKHHNLPLQFSTDELKTVPVVITENTVSELVFKNLPGYRLYLDGLDLISEINPNRVEIDANLERYLKPDYRSYLLYSNRQNNFKYLPGRYLARLVNETTGASLYSEIEVKPRYVSANELVKIKSDLETTVKGLSRYFMTTRHGLVATESDQSKADDIKAIELLYQKHANFKAAIFSLMEQPRFSIRNEYRWMNQMTGSLDRNSLQHMAMNRSSKRPFYGKKRQITYNTRDNLNLKRELNSLAALVKRLKPIAQGLKLNQDVTDQNDDAGDQVINDYDSMLNTMLNQVWMSRIPDHDGHATALISNGNLDYRYAFFNQLDRQLKHPAQVVKKFTKQYHYYWKRTDLLYEIWGYVKVLEALHELKFIPISGWIFNDQSVDYQGLTSGTTVTFKSGANQNRNFTIRVIYDAPVEPTSAKNTTSNKPLWHGNQHNRPDILIEIYDADHIFIKAIILDTKYRNLYDVWQRDTKLQLTTYKDSMFSPYPFRSHKYAVIESLNHSVSQNSAVINVGIIYPGNHDLNADLKPMRSGIDAIACNPDNNGVELLKKFLHQSFADFNKTMDEYEYLIDHQ